MNTVNWTSVKELLPGSRKLVWVGHMRTGAVQLGYYERQFNAFFDQNGEGITASHWAEIVKPEPPTV